MSVSTAFDHVPADEQATSKSEAIPSRLWPTFLVVLLQATFVAIWLSPAVDSFPRFILMMAGPLLCAALFSGLLSFSSRLRWSTSLGVLFGCTLIGVLCGVTAAPRSGMAAWFYGAPLAITLIWIGLAVSRLWLPRQKLLTMLGLSLLGWLGLASLRVDGMDGYYMPTLSLRWSSTTEERILASLSSTQPATSTPKEEQTAWTATTVEWPGFRGPNRNSRVTESLPKLDWTQNPPKELWRRPVGPSWSSMTIVSGRLFTQEQRGDDELVTCYDAATGEPIWQHSETSRFEEITSGAGPRATPTYADGKLFCYGAKAILVALDAATGAPLWRHDVMEEVNASLPIWGFTSSPAVFGDLVVVFAGGSGDNGLMAFDCATGEVCWTIAGGGMNFGSAQPMTFDGTDMLVFVNTGAVLGVNPADGQILWRHEDEVLSTPPIVQPQQIDANSLLLPFGDPGVAKLRITRLEEESGSGHLEGGGRVEESQPQALVQRLRRSRWPHLWL